MFRDSIVRRVPAPVENVHAGCRGGQLKWIRDRVALRVARLQSPPNPRQRGMHETLIKLEPLEVKFSTANHSVVTDTDAKDENRKC